MAPFITRFLQAHPLPERVTPRRVAAGVGMTLAGAAIAVTGSGLAGALGGKGSSSSSYEGTGIRVTSVPGTPRPIPLPTARPSPTDIPKLIPGARYQNELFPGNAADPSVVQANNIYYETNTGGSVAHGGAFPVRTSTDAVHYTSAGHILTAENTPGWIKPDGKFWAPDMMKIGDEFRVVFTAENQQGQLEIGLASAKNPQGPWTVSPEPLVRASDVGVIDASLFHDPKTQKSFVLWKVDGNAKGRTTPIMIAEMDAGTRAITSSPKQILLPTLPRQRNLIEGPEMFQGPDGKYYLEVAANRYGTPDYHEDVAVSDSPTGGFEYLPGELAGNGGGFVGVGHASNVFTAADGSQWLVAHAWKEGQVGPGDGHERVLVMEPLTWGPDGHPLFGTQGRPEAGPQQGPAVEVNVKSFAPEQQPR